MWRKRKRKEDIDVEEEIMDELHERSDLIKPRSQGLTPSPPRRRKALGTVDDEGDPDQRKMNAYKEAGDDDTIIWEH